MNTLWAPEPGAEWTGTPPGPDTTATIGALDRGEAGVVVTTDADIADWADRHGYTVRTTSHQSGTFYEISPGDSGVEDHAVPLD